MGGLILLLCFLSTFIILPEISPSFSLCHTELTVFKINLSAELWSSRISSRVVTFVCSHLQNKVCLWLWFLDFIHLLFRNRNCILKPQNSAGLVTQSLSSQPSSAAAPDNLMHKQQDNNSPTAVCHVDIRDSGQSFPATIDA